MIFVNYYQIVVCLTIGLEIIPNNLNVFTNTAGSIEIHTLIWDSSERAQC